MTTLSRFSDDAVRAQYLADAVDNPLAALDTLGDECGHAVDADGRLVEDECGPTTGLMAALMVGALMDEVDPETGTAADPLGFFYRMSIAADTIRHAAEHGDSLALAIASGETVAESYDAIVEWVTAVLWAEFDADADLILSLAGYEDDGPDAA